MASAGIMLAGISSGSGKTILTCAVMAAFRQRGLVVAAGKCGPDYIDPMFHRTCLGIPSQNLDLFFCKRKELQEMFIKHTAGADLAVVEGVMGYYDGLSPESEEASSYDVAETLGLPVILVVPCKKAARSVAASVLGMLEFHKDNRIKGILLNQISSVFYPRMKKMLEEELKKRGYNVPVAGYLPSREVFHLPSRHLGLVTPDGTEEMRTRLTEMGREATRTMDLDLLLKIARTQKTDTARGAADAVLEETESDIKKEEKKFGNLHPVRVAIARDEAFCFYYEENLRMLQEFGCELVPFSPLHDAELPEEIGGILLGGGYPEVYAWKLSENITMRRQIKNTIANGLPCIAECGGFLYLHEMLEDEQGKEWPMTGVLSGKGFRTDKLGRFGYVSLCAKQDGAYLAEGETIRGHEFHYWNSTEPGTDCLAVKPDGKRVWNGVHMQGNLFAGFPHLYFPSNPRFAERFAGAVKRRRKIRI